MCNEASDSLKTLFTEAEILKIVNPYNSFVLEFDCLYITLGGVLSDCCKKNSELHPSADLSKSPIQAKRN